MSRKRSALVLLLPGLGDALCASPLLRRLSDAAFDIDCLTMLAPVSQYLRGLPLVRQVVELPLLSTPIAALPGMMKLRSEQYDVCALPFPATRWQYAMVAVAAKAKRTYLHDYGGSSRLLGGLAHGTFVQLRGGHRAAENARLADAMALPGSNDLSYLVPQQWKLPQTPGLVGVHTGSMVYKGNEARRWPYEHFVKFVRSEVREHGRRIRLFVGPNEAADGARLAADLAGLDCEIVAEPMEQAARRLSECEVFVGNDAGFSHLAAGLGVKTIALFGMTNPVRATPIGPATALRPSACPPCHDEGLGGFDCVKNLGFRCINRDLKVSDVVDAVEQALEHGIPLQHVVQESAFALYGKARGT